MASRKKLIEEIMANFHALRNSMQSRLLPSKGKDGITHSQLFVLAIIERHRNIGVKAMSKMLNITSSATTQLVDGLVENGYVVRKASSQDRRALQLVLSKKGQRRITDLKNLRMATIATLFEALSNLELETYLRLHKKILFKISV